MDLPTFTSIWKTKRIFYKVEDIRLPMPVPADVLLLSAVCYVVWDAFWWGVTGAGPFESMFGHDSGFAVAACWFILPPFFAARMIARPNREGKNAAQVLTSRARYLFRARVLTGYVSQRHITWWLRYRNAQRFLNHSRQITGRKVRSVSLRHTWIAIRKFDYRQIIRKGEHRK